MIIKMGPNTYNTDDAVENTARAHPLHFILRWCLGRNLAAGYAITYRTYRGKVYLY